jgi:hypothetical protein
MERKMKTTIALAVVAVTMTIGLAAVALVM